MLRIFNDLDVFFEDNYERIHVRRYAKLKKISQPTASKLLEMYCKENILIKEKENKYFYFSANREEKMFIEFQKAYYLKKFKDIINYIKKECIYPVIILFGSFAKAEVTKQSYIDIAIFSPSKKKLDFSIFENKLKREIQVFMFKDKTEARKNPELFNNVLNGVRLGGEW